MTQFFAAAGGLFALLTFIHFFGDWLFQTQFEAINKSKSRRVRARHCTIYTLFFVPVLAMLTTTFVSFLACIVILWGSHYVIDTYVPVLLWARYLRKIARLQKADEEEELGEAFVSLWKEPVYPILFIAVDQIFHLMFLWPVVLFILL